MGNDGRTGSRAYTRPCFCPTHKRAVQVSGSLRGSGHRRSGIGGISLETNTNGLRQLHLDEVAMTTRKGPVTGPDSHGGAFRLGLTVNH